TVLNADFGDGVIIKRLEGVGNGGNPLQMTEESEREAVLGVPHGGGTLHQSVNPEYKRGQGPVSVKVIDPVKIKPYEFELYLSGTPNPIESGRGLIDSTTTWTLVNLTTNDTILSERTLSYRNEQILEEYGISIDIQQAVRPSDRQDLNNNGVIFDDITFADPSNPWLSGVSDEEG